MKGFVIVEYLNFFELEYDYNLADGVIEFIIEVKDLSKINLTPEELRRIFEKQRKEVKD